MPIKTSLRNEVIDSLPFDKKKGKLIFYRPQVGSGVCFKGGLNESINKQGLSETCRVNGKVVANPREFRHTEFDNPNVNSLRAFDSQPMQDNFYQVRKLVLTFNHGTSRRDYHKLGMYRIAYYQSLADCNCCYFCKKPIKVKRARVEGDSRKAHDPFFAEPLQLDKLNKRLDGGKKIRSVAGKPLRGNRYKPHSKGLNVTYGDIKSHFRYVPYLNEAGEKKYRFVYIDGSHRRIEQRKRPNSPVRYFVHVQRDGSEREIVPQFSYRITDAQCKCKKKR